MRKVFSVAITVGLCACASQERPPVEQPEPQYEAPAPAEEQIRASVARSQAEQAEQARAWAAEAKRMAAIGEAAQRAGWDAIAQRKREEREALEAHCAKTRPVRVADAQGYARWYVQTIDRIGGRAKDVKGRCSVEDTRGVRVQTERDGHDRIVRLRETGAGADVVCKGGLPRGLSKDDVFFMLTHQNLARSRVTAETEHDADNQACLEHDRAAGFDGAVTFGDLDGVFALLELKP